MARDLVYVSRSGAGAPERVKATILRSVPRGSAMRKRAGPRRHLSLERRWDSTQMPLIELIFADEIYKKSAYISFISAISVLSYWCISSIGVLLSVES
jgi:hypothetical protein